MYLGRRRRRRKRVLNWSVQWAHTHEAAVRKERGRLKRPLTLNVIVLHNIVMFTHTGHKDKGSWLVD